MLRAAKAADALLRKGVKTVIITLGSRGSYVATSKSKQLVPGFKVKPVDTTAAGDTFNGALAVALAEGKSMHDAVRFANAAGAISVTRMGAQPSAPKRSEIEKLVGGKKTSASNASSAASARLQRPHGTARATKNACCEKGVGHAVIRVTVVMEGLQR